MTTPPKTCGYPCACTHDPASPPRLRSVSYGGGVQSTSLLVLAAQGRIDFDLFLMANVGDDSEHPDSLAYVEHVAKPYAAVHGIELQVLDRRTRDGKVETLWGRLMREDSRSLPIPVRMDNGSPGNRSCTADFKIKVIGRWLKAHGAHGAQPCRAHRPAQRAAQIAAKAAEQPIPDLYAVEGCEKCKAPNPATIAIGISLDEIGRANARRVADHEIVTYPLVGIGEETGLKLRRDDCQRVIRSEPLPLEVHDHVFDPAVWPLLPPSTRAQLEADPDHMPIPPKSSCFFCPFHRPDAWADLNRERPDLFAKAELLEDTLNERRTMLGKDPVWLTRFAIPLREAIDTDAELLPMFDQADGSCETGYCFT